MRRRDFITGLGGVTALWPLVAQAQQTMKTYRVGLLTPSDAQGFRAALVQALEAMGYKEGQNLTLLANSAKGRLETLPAVAKTLVDAVPDVIVAVNSTGTQAAIGTGTTIPIVMSLVGDPVGMGFIKSLSHPGGTVTGLSSDADEIAAKRIALIKEAVPAAKRLAVFTQLGDLGSAVQIKQVENSGRALGLEVRVFPITAVPEDIERAVMSAVAWKADSAYRPLGRGLGSASSKVLVELLLKYRLPATLLDPIDVENGGLMSYTLDLPENWREVAQYVDRILKGASPSELPVATPNRFDFILNLKTARSLGLAIPSSLLTFADQVIE